MEAFVTLAMFAAFGMFMLALLVLFLAGSYLVFGRYTGRRSPWGHLAARYPAAYRPQGQERRWQTLRIGKRLYTSAVGVVLSPAGLYLQIWTPGNHPILVPWREVTSTTASTLALRAATMLRVGRPEVSTITVGPELYAAMWPYLAACHGLNCSGR